MIINRQKHKLGSYFSNFLDEKCHVVDDLVNWLHLLAFHGFLLHALFLTLLHYFLHFHLLHGRLLPPTLQRLTQALVLAYHSFLASLPGQPLATCELSLQELRRA